MSIAGTVVFHGLSAEENTGGTGPTKRRSADHASSALSDLDKDAKEKEKGDRDVDAELLADIDPALLNAPRALPSILSTHNPEGKISLARIEKLKKQGENGIEFAKRGFFNKAWKKRWFVCIDHNLLYFENKTRWDRHASPKGIINLTAAVVKPFDEAENAHFAFTIEHHGTKQRTFYLDATSQKDRQEWMEIIELAAMDNSQFSYKRLPGTGGADAGSLSVSSASSVSAVSHASQAGSFSISKNSQSTNNYLESPRPGGPAAMPASPAAGSHNTRSASPARTASPRSASPTRR